MWHPPCCAVPSGGQVLVLVREQGERNIWQAFKLHVLLGVIKRRPKKSSRDYCNLFITNSPVKDPSPVVWGCWRSWSLSNVLFCLLIYYLKQHSYFISGIRMPSKWLPGEVFGHLGFHNGQNTPIGWLGTAVVSSQGNWWKGQGEAFLLSCLDYSHTSQTQMSR